MVQLLPDERIDDIGRGMKLIQSASTPCFSVDAVLLADFAAVNKVSAIVDMGTGTGILPLLLSRRSTESVFRAVEIMPVMADQARRSVELNGLQHRISIIEGDLRDASLLKSESADMVVANPPYYKLGHGRINQDPVFAAARQECCCRLEELALASAKVLKSKGVLCLILPAKRLAELMVILDKAGLCPSRLRMVQPYAHKAANLVLVEAIKNCRCELTVEPALVIYGDPGAYSKEMEEIYER